MIPAKVSDITSQAMDPISSQPPRKKKLKVGKISKVEIKKVEYIKPDKPNTKNRRQKLTKEPKSKQLIQNVLHFSTNSGYLYVPPYSFSFSYLSFLPWDYQKELTYSFQLAFYQYQAHHDRNSNQPLLAPCNYSQPYSPRCII